MIDAIINIFVLLAFPMVTGLLFWALCKAAHDADQKRKGDKKWRE